MPSGPIEGEADWSRSRESSATTSIQEAVVDGMEGKEEEEEDEDDSKAPPPPPALVGAEASIRTTRYLAALNVVMK